MELETLVVPLVLDKEKYTSGLESAKGEANQLTSGLSAMGGGIVLGGMAAVGAGAGLLTAGLIDSTKAAIESENVQAQLNAVLESTGGAAGMSADAINDLASGLQSVTKFEDDAIVSGQNILLTFTGIGKDVFPQATETMLNMSQALGQDLKGSATQLGKALNDPINGMTALSRVGVVFTDEQKAMVKQLQESGDLVGAQTVILKELELEYGNSARAAGQTASGKWTIFLNKMGDIKETIGGAVIPIIGQLAETFSAWLDNPATQAGITNIVTGLTGLATQAVTLVPQVIDTLQGIANWFMNNEGVIIGILASLGVAVGAFVYTTVIPAIVATLTTLAPVIAVMAAVGLAAYLLYQAWSTNFLGIRDKLTEVWEGKLKPAFTVIKSWLDTNLPVALQALTNVWQNVLLPALNAVWSFLNLYVFPLLGAIAEFLIAVFKKNLEIFAAVWETLVLPALKQIWEWLDQKVFPVFKKVGDFLSDKLTPAFEGLGSAVAGVIEWVQGLASTIRSIPALPPWMRPGSPMPLDWAFRWLGDSIRDVATDALPELNNQLSVHARMSPAGRDIAGRNERDSLDEFLRKLDRQNGKFSKQLSRDIRDAMLQVS